MASAPNVPIAAFKRVPFDDILPVVGINLTGASFALHVRTEFGNASAPLISLGALSSGQGISVSYSSAYAIPNSDPIETAPASLIRIQILEATLEALALNADPSKPLSLVYDLHVTPSGGTKYVQCIGDFIIKPGSTI